MITEARFQLNDSENSIIIEPKALKNEYQKDFEDIFSICSKKYVTSMIDTPNIPM